MTAKPYGEVLDEMDHEAKYLPATIISLEDVLTTLKHARVFIASREKMHPIGIELYDELTKRIEDAIHPASARSN